MRWIPPRRAETLIDGGGVGGVALAEGGEVSTIWALEDTLDPDLAVGGQRGGGEPVARGEAVLHALDHRFELCDINPQDWVAAMPSASSKPAASSP